MSTTILNPQEAADALGVSVYSLGYMLRRQASESLERFSKNVSAGVVHPWSGADLEEEFEHVRNLMAAVDACEATRAE